MNDEEKEKPAHRMIPHSPVKDLDIKLRAGYRSNCKVCNHESLRDMTMVYFKSNKDVAAVNKWLKENYGITFITKSLSNHFETHIEGYVTEQDFLKQQKYDQIIDLEWKRMYLISSERWCLSL